MSNDQAFAFFGGCMFVLGGGVVWLVLKFNRFRRVERIRRASNSPLPNVRLLPPDRSRAAQWHPKQSTQRTPMSDKSRDRFHESFDFDGD